MTFYTMSNFDKLTLTPNPKERGHFGTNETVFTMLWKLESGDNDKYDMNKFGLIHAHMDQHAPF